MGSMMRWVGPKTRACVGSVSSSIVVRTQMCVEER